MERQGQNIVALRELMHQGIRRWTGRTALRGEELDHNWSRLWIGNGNRWKGKAKEAGQRRNRLHGSHCPLWVLVSAGQDLQLFAQHVSQSCD